MSKSKKSSNKKSSSSQKKEEVKVVNKPKEKYQFRRTIMLNGDRRQKGTECEVRGKELEELLAKKYVIKITNE